MFDKEKNFKNLKFNVLNINIFYRFIQCMYMNSFFIIWYWKAQGGSIKIKYCILLQVCINEFYIPQQ